ncbi:MAG: 16S rRNA (cytosine(1402)-N(4))-methyltransferase RsmH, partial [Planctomycetota bacterium]
TIGLGGHAETLLAAAGKDALLIGIDVDDSNFTEVKKRISSLAGSFRLFQGNFSELPTVLKEAGVEAADAIIVDLGISSVQLDDPGRGFSFTVAGPLDMRMDRRIEHTAGDLVNKLSEKELADLIYTYGEDRYSRRIARAIVAERKRERIENTIRLAQIVAGAYPHPTRKTRRGVHPATRTFQSLRIAVNDELGNLDRLLQQLPNVLAPGGRAAIISFHSLEDRRVKRAFIDMERTGAAKRLTKKPIVPAGQELERNPRARSAKLRGIERIK